MVILFNMKKISLFCFALFFIGCFSLVFADDCDFKEMGCLDSKLEIINAEVGGEAVIILSIVSRKELGLEDVFANISIYSELGEEIANFKSDEYIAPFGEKVDIVSRWKADVLIGNYKAKVTFVYDEGVLNLEEEFKVGKSFIELQDIYSSDFNLGKIVKVDMLLENKWSEPVSGIRGVLEIFDKNGVLVDKVLSSSYNIAPFSKQVIPFFWDSGDVEVGSYDVNITLEYSINKIENELEFIVDVDELQVLGLAYSVSSDNRGSKNNGDGLVVAVVLVVVVLVVMNLLWFLKFNKKTDNKKK